MIDRPSAPWWTEADQAELDVFIHELARRYFEHRERCETCRPGDCPDVVSWRAHLNECPACDGRAPLTFGPPCSRRREFVAHADTCRRCQPCAALRTAIDVVLEWRELRFLLSRAEALRADHDVQEVAP